MYPDPEAPAASRGLDHEHPIFTPVSVMSRTPLFETDYNLHKSNSTYFSDLDIARTSLVTKLYTPGVELTRREMESETDVKGKTKYPGRIAVMLGSVYCTFKKEVLPYEKYEMQSKIAGWDGKWMYILTFFLRPEKRKGQGKTLLAVGISKYVVKKGRLTVPPARILRASGLLPVAPNGDEQSKAPSATETPPSGEAINAGEGLDEAVVREVLTLTKEDANRKQTALEHQKRDNSRWGQTEWTWERIEQERQRGLRVIRPIIDIDADLGDEADLR